MKDNDTIVLKFGNTQEALESLAKCYGVDLDVIESNLPQLKSLYKEYFYHDDDVLLLKSITILLSGKSDIDINFTTFRIHFYHRTSYSGDINWFSKGLLSGPEAIGQYIQNLHDLAPDLNLIQDQKILIDKNKYKHPYFKPQNDEVYAFLNLKSAKLKKYHFYNYSEIIYDYTENNPLLLDQIKNLVTPCTVEFYLEKDSKSLKCYLFHYWRLLLDESDETCGGVKSNSKGDVPFENIINIEPI